MNSNYISEYFPDFYFEPLPQSKIPRMRILFNKNRTKSVIKAINEIFDYVFGNNNIFVINQLFSVTILNKRIRKEFLDELELLGLGNLYDNPKTEIYHSKGEGWEYRRFFELDKDIAKKLATIDGTEHTKDVKSNGIPEIYNMDNYYYNSKTDLIINIVGWWGAMDISSYNKDILYKISQELGKKYKILTDKI